MSTSNRATTHWAHNPNNVYGTWDFEKTALYNRQQRYCLNGGNTGYRRLVPTGFTGEFKRLELVNRKYPKKCVSTFIGSFSVETGTASTISRGVNLPSFYGIDVNSQSGFSKNTKVDFKINTTGKYLCGTNNKPEASYPGVIMADYKLR